ncbi:Inner membrane transport protein YajR [Candidatus Annandia adelgestsuga]|uniref:Inner membrane transport protein YajR n=1 Tax=Candidatus Annandia adelgestsuga TaxID=1302411 RepID=A0A3S9J7W7_9ENTR|nr:MFS transporter [Candidatus Annandia adelgestsuga]AZP36383.1 Inner membrane transport protein YajR [Candidatus Annandia adelgestsuga]
MNKIEHKAIISLIIIFILRMSGILMLLPIMNIYLPYYHIKSNLIPIAISIYGLMQILFQLPYGLLSDMIGRKPIIKLGLLVFSLGSLIAAYVDNVYFVVLGRILQGSGIVHLNIVLLMSDLIREENISKSMAILNIFLIFTFLISLIIGPIIACVYGLKILFFLMAILSLIGIIILSFLVPEEHPICQKFNFRKQFMNVINNLQLLKINFSVLFLHILLNITFLIMPKKLFDVGFNLEQHWQMYLIEFFISLFLTIPIIMILENSNKIKKTLRNIIILIFIIYLILWKLDNYFWILILDLQIFFTIFTVLESMLPSMISRESSLLTKGVSMGLYNVFQLLGSVSGCIIKKYIEEKFNINYLFMLTFILVIIWFLLIITIEEPFNKSNIFILLDNNNYNLSLNKLYKNKGILEAVISYNKKKLYLKIDNKLIKKENIKDIVLK